MRELVNSVIRMNSTDGLRRGSSNIENEASFYDNLGFSRGASVSSKKSIHRSQAELQIDPSQFDEIEVDDDSFRSDLERDSVHSSMNNYAAAKSFDRQMSHEERYARLQRQSQRRTSSGRRNEVAAKAIPRYPVLDNISTTETRPKSHEPRPKAPVPPSPIEKDDKPEPSISNLFGVIDTRKLKSLWSVELDDRSSKYIYSGSQLDPIPEASAPPMIEEVECEQMYDRQRVNDNAPTLESNPYKTGCKYYIPDEHSQVRLAFALPPDATVSSQVLGAPNKTFFN